MNSVYYELMDTDTANVVGFYDTRDAALAIVRRAYERFGLSAIEGLALSEEDVQGDGRLLAEGAELLRLAMEAPLTAATG